MSSSSTITEAGGRGLGRRIKPGEVLAELWLDPLGLDARSFGETIAVPTEIVQELLDGKRRIDADIALRISKAFGTKPEFWLSMQAGSDLHERAEVLRDELDRIEPIPTKDAA